MLKKSLLVCFSLVLISCSSNVPVQKSNLTVGMIKSKVIKTKTTQTDILNIFGAPNLITKNKSNDEVWSYNKMSTDSNSSSSFATVLLAGTSSAAISKTTSSFDWIITFDSDNIVKDYSIISSSY